MQIAKNILRKAEDPYLALLAYRTTPTHTGYSPAQMLMGRNLRTTLPSPASALKPALPDNSLVAESDRTAKQRQERDFNKRHRARSSSPRRVGEEVWVPDLNTKAVVTAVLPFRSYELRTSSGNIVRRNSRALRSPRPQAKNTQQTDDDTHRDVALPLTEQPAPPTPPPTEPVTTTRSGRRTRAPDRLNL